MSNSITKTEEHIQINNPEKLIKETIQSINAINIKLKDKNLVGAKRVAVEETFQVSVEQLVDITAAALNNGIITTDEHGIIQAKVSSKTFKNCAGHVNSIIKKYLTIKQKVPLHTGAQISDIELAKLIQTPYSDTKEGADEAAKLMKEPKQSVEEQKEEATAQGYDDNQMKLVDMMPGVNGDSVVTISSIHGEEAVVDKKEKAIYVKGNVGGKMVIWKKKIVSTAYTWYETAKNVAIAMFKLVWSYVSSVGSSIFGGVIGIGAVAVGMVTNTGNGIVEGSKSFWSSIKSARKEAKAKARANGYFYGEANV